MPEPFRIKAGDVVRSLRLEVRVTGLKVTKVRLWLGIPLIKLAGLIIGAPVEVTFAGLPRAPAHRPSLAMPPVRLSLADFERGVAPVDWTEANRIRVMLDNVEARNVTAYDCEAGWIERHKLGPDRKPVIENEALVIERVHGKVTAEFRKDPS